MNKRMFRKYLEKQIAKINEEKWYEGERIKCDPGQEFVIKWIAKNAKKFRKDFTLEELEQALKDINCMINDLTNLYLNTDKMKVWLEDLRDKVEFAKEYLETESNNHKNNQKLEKKIE